MKKLLVAAILLFPLLVVGAEPAYFPTIWVGKKANFTETTAPATPSAGQVSLYAKSTKKLYIKDSTGTETELGTGGGGSFPSLASDGDATNPSYAWSTNPGVGIYYVNGDTSMNFSFGTTATLKFKSDGIYPIAGGLDIGTQSNPFDDIFANRYQMVPGGQVIFRNATNSISFTAPAGLAADYAFTLPLNDGTPGQFLQTNGSGVLTWVTGSGSVPDPLQLSDGSPSAPTYSFASDPDSGMWMGGGSELIFTANGNNQVAIVPGGLKPIAGAGTKFNGTSSEYWDQVNSEFYYGTDGSSGNPTFSFIGDPDTGMWHGGSNTLIFTGGGSNVMAIAPGVMVPTGAGISNGTSSAAWDSTWSNTFYGSNDSAATPTYGFISDAGLGAYRSSANTYSIATSGSEHFRVNSSGGVMTSDDGYGFIGDGGTVINHPNANEISFITNSAIRFKATDEGLRMQNNVGVVSKNSSNSSTLNLIRLNGSDLIELGIYTMPAGDGSSGQVLSTDGSANLGWVTPSGTGALAPQGSQASPQTITAAGGITSTADQRQIWFVVSAGGAVSITATPQITAGTTVGQELMISGTSATNYIILSDGNGLSLNGPINLTDNSGISLVWNGSVWTEISRR